MDEERLAAIERRLDILEGRVISIDVNPSGLFRVRKGVTIEKFYDYKTKETLNCEPPIVVPETGWYVADRAEGQQPRLHFHGAT